MTIILHISVFFFHFTNSPVSPPAVHSAAVTNGRGSQNGVLVGAASWGVWLEEVGADTRPAGPYRLVSSPVVLHQMTQTQAAKPHTTT